MTLQEKKYIDFLEENGYIIFENILQLKKVVLETISYEELIQEIVKRHSKDSDCNCGG